MCSKATDTLDFDCGIAYRRIAAWLDEEIHLPFQDGRWTFSHDTVTCTIYAEALESRPLGLFALERTRLTATGDPQALAAFNKLFTLRFISAGG